MDNYPGSVSCASLGSQICIPVLLLFGWLIARRFIWVLFKRVHDDKLVEVSLVVGSTFWWRCFDLSHMMPIDARMPAESSGLRVQVFLEASAKSLQSLLFAVNVNRSAFFPEVLDFLHHRRRDAQFARARCLAALPDNRKHMLNALSQKLETSTLLD
ncbi:MAG: hypothetical protein SGPRY_015070 [Prymnesium sp.]